MPITPMLPTTPSDEGITQSKVSAWERAVMPIDGTYALMEGMDTITEDVSLYVLNDDNKMIKVDPRDVDAATMANYADAGRVFAVNGDPKQIRQFQLHEDEGLCKVLLTEPITNLAGMFEVEPMPWWKRLLYLFFSDEVKAHDRNQAMIDLMDSQEMIDAFEIMEGKMPQSEIDRLERERIADEEKMANLEKLDLERFEAMINAMGKNSPAILDAAMKSDRTVDSITEAFMRKVDQNVAREIRLKIEKNPENKEQILREGKENFTDRLTELREFALRAVDKSVLEGIAKDGIRYNFRVTADLEEFTENLCLEHAKYKQEGEKYFTDRDAVRQAQKEQENVQKQKEQEIEQQKEQEIAQQKAAKLQEFENKLIRDAAGADSMEQLTVGSPMNSEIQLAMEEKAVSRIAQSVLDRANEDPGKKSDILEEAMKSYSALVENVAEYLREQVQNNAQVIKDINCVSQNGDNKERALDRLEKVSENAVAEYGKTLMEKTVANTAEKAQPEKMIEERNISKGGPVIG